MLFQTGLAQTRSITVLLDGKVIKTEAQIQHRRVLVPLRLISENLGAQVDYDPDTLKVTVRRNNTVVELWPGSRHAMVNGEEKLFDTSMSANRGRVLVPLRFLSETLGLASVGWRPASRTVVIKS